MAKLRKIGEYGPFKIYRDSEWEEYRVISPDGGSYHTDDKQDRLRALFLGMILGITLQVRHDRQKRQQEQAENMALSALAEKS